MAVVKPRELRGWKAMRGNNSDCRGYRKPGTEYSIYIFEDSAEQLHYSIGIGSGDYFGQLPDNPANIGEALALIEREETRTAAARSQNQE